MLYAKDLTKSFGAQILFQQTDFQLNPGERVGVVGRNGSGKSTLFRLLQNPDQLDEGTISYPENYRIGSLDQHLVFNEKSILDEVAISLSADQAHNRWKAEKLLSGLGFKTEDFTKAPSTFSGGYQIRVKLAQLLLSKPNLLLLDEPTNYLDILTIRWLEKFLKHWTGEVICISHDQTFLAEISTHTMAVHRKKFKKIKGAPAKCFAQIAREEALHERTRIGLDKKTAKQEKFIREFRSGARSAGLVQSRIKMLAKQDNLKALPKIAPIEFTFQECDFNSAKVVDAHNLTFGYDPESELLKQCSFEIMPGEKIGIIGANGKGKSTLLKLLNQEITPRSGTLKVHENVVLGYMGQSNISKLDPTVSVLQTLSQVPNTSEQMARVVAGNLLFSGGLAYKPIKVLSGGEKARVNLGKILLSPVNFLCLDEPTNHLDYESIQAFTKATKAFSGAVIFVSHNETFLREVADKLIVFDNDEVYFYPHNYQTFLQKKGFVEEVEETESSAPTKAKTPLNISAEKLKIKQLRPLRKKLKIIEKEITHLEDQQKENIAHFKTAELQGNRLKMETLGIEYQELHTKLDQALKNWEIQALEIETIENDGN